MNPNNYKEKREGVKNPSNKEKKINETGNNIAETLTKKFNEFEKNMSAKYGKLSNEEINELIKNNKIPDEDKEYINKNYKQIKETPIENKIEKVEKEKNIPEIKKQEIPVENKVEKVEEKKTEPEKKTNKSVEKFEKPVEKKSEPEKKISKIVEKVEKPVEKKSEKKIESGKKKFFDRKIGKVISAPVRIPYDIVTGTGKRVRDGISMNGKKGWNGIKSVFKGGKDLIVDNTKWLLDAPKRARNRVKGPFKKK